MKTFLSRIGAALDSRTFILVIATLGVAGGSWRLLGHASQRYRPAAAHVPNIERGDYLVNSVGMCADCHTPRDATGQFVTDRWMWGCVLDIKPTVELPAWADVALPIAGLPTFPTDEEAVMFLVEGKRADGRVPRPPMPAFRFTRADAIDVVAYLRSLKSPSGNVPDAVTHQPTTVIPQKL